ncbi:hypothetical protein HAX54_040270 [Datura stramonium]|uniref:Uncharacterized protein n=1 Tax=Datura stramonium TaxID=4076 RepID=A0ABS8SK64_DATST|nr:hypothetical protein [Datura stramonium]
MVRDHEPVSIVHSRGRGRGRGRARAIVFVRNYDKVVSPRLELTHDDNFVNGGVEFYIDTTRVYCYSHTSGCLDIDAESFGGYCSDGFKGTSSDSHSFPEIGVPFVEYCSTPSGFTCYVSREANEARRVRKDGPPTV